MHASSQGGIVTDDQFVDQGHVLTIVDSVISAASMISASNSNYIDIAIYGGYAGDFIAILNMDTWDGCSGAPVAKSTFACTSNIGTSLSGITPYCVHIINQGKFFDAMYKLCYATALSDGDSNSDFIEQALNMTIDSATEVTTLNLTVDNGATFGLYGMRRTALSKDKNYIYVIDMTNRNIKIINIASETQHIFYSPSDSSTFTSLCGLCSHAGDGHSIFIVQPTGNKVVRIR